MYGKGDEPQEQAAQDRFEFEGDAREREFDAYRFEPALVKAFKALAFMQLGETGFDDRFVLPISGTRQRVIQQLRHPLSEFLVGKSLDRVAALESEQWLRTGQSRHWRPYLAVSKFQRTMFLIGKGQFTAGRELPFAVSFLSPLCPFPAASAD